MNTMLHMGVFEKIPREGSIAARELAASVNKNEEVLSELSSYCNVLQALQNIR